MSGSDRRPHDAIVVGLGSPALPPRCCARRGLTSCWSTGRASQARSCAGTFASTDRRGWPVGLLDPGARRRCSTDHFDHDGPWRLPSDPKRPCTPRSLACWPDPCLATAASGVGAGPSSRAHPRAGRLGQHACGDQLGDRYAAKARSRSGDHKIRHSPAHARTTARWQVFFRPRSRVSGPRRPAPVLGRECRRRRRHPCKSRKAWTVPHGSVPIAIRPATHGAP